MNDSRVVRKLPEAISEIGSQHQKLTEYYRQVEALIVSGSEDFATLEAVLDGLIEYAIRCFDLEETLMKLVAYQHITEHLRSHDMFMRRLSGYRGRLMAGNYTANELMSLLRIWMAGHIHGQDKHFIGTLEGIAAGGA